jgi:hypothetical protein
MAGYIWHADITTTLWSIWKARTDLVFNSKTSMESNVVHKAGDDLAIGRWRYTIHDHGRLNTLRSFLLSASM